MVLADLRSIWTDAAKLTNIRVAGYRKSRYLIRKSTMFIQNEAMIARRVYCVK